jgi:hypothetical protein
MSLEVISVYEVMPQPWRNGGGLTRELWTWPSAEGWWVRVSVADIEKDGPFSTFPAPMCRLLGRSIVASVSDTITVTSKVRLDDYVGSPGLGGCAIWVENNQNAEVILLTPAGLRLYNKNSFYAMDTMDGYHEYKIVATGNTLHVYVDGEAIPLISTTFGGQSWAARGLVRFGDGSYGASARSSWAYIRYTVESP